MKSLIKGSPVKVIEWSYHPEYNSEKFISTIPEAFFSLTDISLKEANVFYFKVAIRLKVFNYNSEVLFHGETQTIFKLLNNISLPTADQLYDMYIEGIRDFGKEFEKMKGTILYETHHPLVVSQYGSLETLLDSLIQEWAVKNHGG